jgi:uncharacterized membrane protein
MIYSSYNLHLNSIWRSSGLLRVAGSGCRHLRRSAGFFRFSVEIIQGALHLNSYAIIQLGLLLLIATPIARIAFAFFAFARERDGVFVVVGMIVLGLLAFSLLGMH